MANNYESKVADAPIYSALVTTVGGDFVSEEPLIEDQPDGSEALEKLRPVLVAVAPEIVSSTDAGSDASERFDQWLFQESVVTVPRFHVRGKLEQPVEDWLFGWRLRVSRDDHFTIEDSRTISAESFFERANALATDERILLFVHGFGTRREAAVMRAAQLAVDTRFSGAAMAFVWPTQGKKGLASYLRDRTALPDAGAALAELLRELQRRGAEVCVFGHSLGCAVIANALMRIAADTSPLRLAEIIFGAPDIGLAEFRRVMPVVRGIANRLTIYTSLRDAALMVSAWINHRTPIGLGQRPSEIISKGSEIVDATRVWQQFYRLDHAYVFGSSRLLADIHATLKGQPQTRFELRKIVAARRWEFLPVKT